MLFLVVGAIICVCIFRKEYSQYDEYGLLCSVGLIYRLFIGAIVWLIIGGIIGCNLPISETVKVQEICELNDSTLIEERNYLTTGYKENELICIYAINTDKGRCIKEIDADKVFINEGDYIPTVEIHKTSFSNGWCYLFAHDLFCRDEYVVFCIPENTITAD